MTPGTEDEFRPRCLLVTGGAGFVGSTLVRRVLASDQATRVINLDALTYAANPASLADVEREHGAAAGSGRYDFVRGDVRDGGLVAALLRGERGAVPDAVVHLAAETHVDRSILEPLAFASTNVQGTAALLAACREELVQRPRAFRFVQVSTDEVYGALADGEPPFTESSPLMPNSPYAASKAGADLLVRGYVQTYAFPAIVTRGSNNYGPRQFPEKLIPLMITRALSGERLPLYGDGGQVRDWIHVEDHAAGVQAALARGRLGETYNLGAGCELTNLDVVQRILHLLGRPESLIERVVDRAGHDRRYALDCARARRELGWHARRSFETGLEETVRWYVAHPDWWTRAREEASRATDALYLRESGRTA